MGNEKLTDCYGVRYDPKGKFCAVCVVHEKCERATKAKKLKTVRTKTAILEK